MTFEDLGLRPNLIEGLDSMGYTKPTPIQQQAIPYVLAARDLIAIAQTGTGKTGAYLLPVIHQVLNQNRDHISALILVPTRELAMQVDQQIEGLGYFTGISSAPVYGGGDGVVWEQQKKALQMQADIVVATPGRLISHISSDIVRFDHLTHLVLDEADRMLDMGFYDDIVRIINYLPKKRQTMLFSATMPSKIRTLANSILHSPAEVSIAVSRPADNVVQQAYLVNHGQKADLLAYILSEVNYSSVIVFTATKSGARKLESLLRRRGIRARAFHSDLEQFERERLLGEFKSGKLPVLVGTDILSRGIDVEGIELVVNFDVPSDPEDYIHRIGRTARAAHKGIATMLVCSEDQRKYQSIERFLGKEIPKLDLPSGFEQPLVEVHQGDERQPRYEGSRKIPAKRRR